jgi:hypothetical protein
MGLHVQLRDSFTFTLFINIRWISIHCHFIQHAFHAVSVFHFGQHIIKMLFITTCKLLETCSQVSQCLPQHVFWHCWNLLLNCDLDVIYVCGLVVYTSAFCNPNGYNYRWGKHAGHGRSPHNEIMFSGNLSWMTSTDALTVWAVELSCWNHMVMSSIPQGLCSGVRKFCIISLQQADMTVTAQKF